MSCILFRFSLLDEAILQNVDSLDITAETLTLSDIEILSPALLAKAGEDTDSSAVETLYRRFFRGSSEFWSTRYGPRFVYLLLSQRDCDNFASEVVTDMIATISHQVFATKASRHIKTVLQLFNIFVSASLRSARFSPPSQYQGERDLQDVHLALRLVCFILNFGGPSGIGYEFFFHSLCWLGLLDLIQFFAETVRSNTLNLAFSKLENRMSPLYYAAVSGHVGVVKYLVGKGCPVLHSDPTSPPAFLAAILHNRKCLANVLHKSGCNTDLFGKLRPMVISWLWMDNPHRVFSESERSDAFELLQFLTAECDISDIVRHENWFGIFLGLMAVSLRSDTIEALLVRLHEIVSLPESVAAKLCEKTLYHIIKLSNISISNTPPASLQLFDDVILKSLDAPPSGKFAVLAASKGFWKTASKFFSGGQIQPFKGLSMILSKAVKDGVLEVLTVISSSVEESGGLHFEHLIEPMCTAAECGESAVDAWNILLCLKPLQSNLSESLSVDFYTKPFCKAIRLRNDSLIDAMISYFISADEPIPTRLVSQSLEAATRSNNQYAIEKLHSLLLSKHVDLPPFQDASLSFWTSVLLRATNCGHEELSLEAIGYLSESHLSKLMTDEETNLELLNCCCWWGMKDVLECLPVSSSKLFLTATKNGDLPWFSAAFNGQAGKLSHLDAFPSLGEVSDFVRSAKHKNYFLFDQNKNCLFNGAFHKLLSSRGQKRSMADYIFYKYQLDNAHFFANQVSLGLLEPVTIYLDHLGKYAGDFVESYIVPGAKNGIWGERKSRTLLSVACSRRDNLAVVELILKALFNSCAGLSGRKYISEFVLCVRRGEVEYARAFVHCVPSVVEKSSTTHNLLNEAVRSDNPKMVDYIISLLGDAAPDECYRMNENYEYPLFSAFSFKCSRVVVESSLMETAAASFHFISVSLHPDWRRAARKTIGWFDLMMRSHAKMVKAHRGLSREPSYPILGSTPETEPAAMPRYPMMCLKEVRVNEATILPTFLHLSVIHKLPSMTFALLFSSICSVDAQQLEPKHCRILFEIFTNPIFLKPPANCQAASFWGFLSQRFTTKFLSDPLLGELLKKSISQEKTILLLDEFVVPGRGAEPEILKSVFINACWLGNEKVVDHILSLGQKHQLHDGILEEGMQLAVSGGRLSLAANLKQRLTSPAPFLPENSIHQCIFTETSYYDVLNTFFTSLCLPCQRSPLAAHWIMREWSEAEAQLIIQQFTLSTYAPPNPWTLPLGSQELVVTVDWDSFSECLLTSPSAVLSSTGDSLGSKFRNVPLLVEAIVFSQAVLGQLVSPMCSKEGSQPWHSVSCSHGDGGGASFLSAMEGLSALIVSCVVWPATPSFSTFGGDQGILTISYQPHTRTVVFPDIITHPSATTEESQLFSNQDPHCFPVSARFEDLGIYHEKVISELMKCVVAVEFDLEILEGEYEDVDLQYSLVSVHLNDIVKSLKLALQLFTKQYEGKKGWSQSISGATSSPVTTDSSSALQGVFESVRIHFEVEPDVAAPPTTPPTVYEVSSERDTLDITAHLPSGVGGFANSDLSSQTHYTWLVDSLLESIVRAKVVSAQSQVVDEIGANIASLLKSSLKLMSASSGMFKLSVEAKNGLATKFSEFDPVFPEDLVYFKVLKKLKHFLCSFCKMLKVFQYQPKLRSSICGLFEAGLHVTLSASSPSTQGPNFSIKSAAPHLAIPVHQLLPPGGLHASRGSLQNLFQSMLEVSMRGTGGRNMTTPLISSPPKCFPPPGVPAPFACHVDLNQADGLLYPVLEKMGEIVVQLVDFNGKPLTTSPSVNCHLDVKIRLLGSAECIASATSSGDPNPQSASRHLLVTEGASGTFKIVWTPQDSGLHVVLLTINNQFISSSPYKVFVADPNASIFGRGPGSCGLRQTNTDQPVVFVARHVKHCCCNISDPPPVHLFNKKPLPIPGLTKTQRVESREEFLQRLDKEDGRIHHISMCSAYGGAASQKWLHLPSATLSVHIYRENDDDSKGRAKPALSIGRFKMSVMPLGNGFYRVSLLPTAVGSYSLFVSCSYCHSVLTVLWKSGGCGFLPTYLYVVSGRISQLESTLRVVRPTRRSQRRFRRKGKTLTIPKKTRSLIPIDF